MEGPLSAPGGPFLRDQYGRVVVLHGVNAVYKLPPYELTDAPGQPNDFSAGDAASMAALGFDVVRLGIIWEGLEPGTLGPNSPSVCTPGTPGDPGQFDQATLDAYLAKVKETVDLLGRYHIYTLLDMHQDLYSSVFGGEGAPPWAVCDDGLSPAQLPGRWSATYHSPALQAALGHFWSNDVVGNLQGEYDRMWGAVAAYFHSDPWVLGYDPMNEPYSVQVTDTGHHDLAVQLECFYAGTAAVDHDPALAGVTCPADDPAEGVVPTIEANDPGRLVFVEPDIYSGGSHSGTLEPMDFPDLVFNFHDYCPERSPVTGNPTDVTACTAAVTRSLARHAVERAALATSDQPGGPPAFMSEFGASGDPAVVGTLTSAADQDLLGWTYWAWKFYDDPTGSSDEALVGSGGQLKPTVAVLAETYPQAVAGTPTASSFDPGTGSFSLHYTSDPRIDAPTVVEVPALHYPDGYCAQAAGGVVASAPGATHLLVENLPGSHPVTVTVTAGRCP